MKVSFAKPIRQLILKLITLRDAHIGIFGFNIKFLIVYLFLNYDSLLLLNAFLQIWGRKTALNNLKSLLLFASPIGLILPIEAVKDLPNSKNEPNKH